MMRRQSADGGRRARLRLRRCLYWCMVSFAPLVIKKVLMAATGCDEPVLVALSCGNMYRGDLIFLTTTTTNNNNKKNCNQPLSAGDVVAFRVRDRDIPSVHRIITAIKVHSDDDSSEQRNTSYYNTTSNGSNNNDVNNYIFLTKGDDNRADDRGLYAPGQIWLKREDIIGRVYGRLPVVGYVPIFLWDYSLAWHVLVAIEVFNTFLATRTRKQQRPIQFWRTFTASLVLWLPFITSGAYP